MAASTPPPARRFLLWLVLAVASLNGLATLIAYVGLQEVKDRDIRRTEMKSQDLSRAVRQSTEQLIDKIDLALRIAVYELERHQDWDQNNEAFHSRIRARLASLIPESEGLSAVSSDGEVVFHEGQLPLKRFNVRDRAYFIALQNGHEGLYVNKPVISRRTGRPIILFARSFRTPKGSFGGIVAIPTDIDQFRSVISGYAIGPDSVLSLRSLDMALIARQPDTMLGQSLPPGSQIGIPKEAWLAAGQGLERLTDSATIPLDGIRRVFSIQRLSNAPMYALCGIAEQEFMADWLHLRRMSIVFLGGGCALTLVVAWVLYRIWRRQQNDATSLRNGNVKLQQALQDIHTRDRALNAAREVGGLATYALDIVSEVWERSPEQEVLFGIGPNYPRTGQAWGNLLHVNDLPRLKAYFDTRAQAHDDTFDFEYRIIRPSDGAERWMHGVGKIEYDADGAATNIIGATRDVTEEKTNRERTEHLAYHDILTGLPNRMLLADRMRQALAQAKRRGEYLAVCYLDLDGFKPINDTWGHSVGDALLVEAAHRLEVCTRTGDTVSRLGGDEFVILLCGLHDRPETLEIAQRIREAISRPYRIDGIDLTLTMSMGITTFPLDSAEDADVLLRHADQAMYEAKRSGKNRVHFFDPEDDRQRVAEQAHYANVISALDSGAFLLHFQPKVNMRDGNVLGMEALMRWRHPERGLLLPGSFLPGIEKTDLTRALDTWVLDEALRQLRSWRGQGLDTRISVNIFGHHLHQPDFIDGITAALARFPDVPPDRLILEILETTAVQDLDVVSERIEDCMRLGLDFALDDFGTGYSSLTYFRRLPVTFLKIDRSFVAGLPRNAEDCALVESIVGMAHALGRTVIAEGVETLEHGVALARYGCDIAQGFGIARPMPAEDVIPWTRAWTMPEAWKTATLR